MIKPDIEHKSFIARFLPQEVCKYFKYHII